MGFQHSLIECHTLTEGISFMLVCLLLHRTKVALLNNVLVSCVTTESDTLPLIFSSIALLTMI